MLEARSKIHSIGNKKILEMNCMGCEARSGIENKVCLGEIMNLLIENGGVDEITLNGIYKRSYNKEQTQVLSEFANTLKDVWRTSPWKELYSEEQRKFIYELIVNEFRMDPVGAYKKLALMLELVEKENGDKKYIEILTNLSNQFGSTQFIKCKDIYDFFTPAVRPAFLPFLDIKIPEDAKPVEIYNVKNSRIRIYELAERFEHLYFIDLPELWLYPRDNRLLYEAIKRITKKTHGNLNPSAEMWQYFKKLGEDLICEISEEKGITLDKIRIGKLAEIFARYTAGYGVLEILFSDDKIQDIYVDSPPGLSPLYIYHEEYEECSTNLYLTEDELERVASRLRAISGRAFDIASPVLDAELQDPNIRIAGICEPATFGGMAYAFRRHRSRPWTLPQFIEKNTLSPLAAGIISFLVSSQKSILITGARGCGKTSLLSALITEIPRRYRIITLEDTPEIPALALKKAGWKIQQLKSKSALSTGSSHEVSPEDNLRAALRLGESILVIGEVRGYEAKVLFEAMRIGAAGNAVLGTIHGSSPYDTWDRIVNDLKVPSTSFKATDIIIPMAYRQKKEDIRKKRKVISITEVRKNWSEGPTKENAFFDLVEYDARSDDLNINKDINSSEILADIARIKGIRVEDCLEEIKYRAKTKGKLVEICRMVDKPELLEIEHVVKANERYNQLLRGNSYKNAYRIWEDWLNGYVEGL